MKVFEWTMVVLYVLIGIINAYRTRRKKEIDVISYWLVYIAMMTILLEKAIG